jgi:CubicO group peptidase (beta-lactamase class C family)
VSAGVPRAARGTAARLAAALLAGGVLLRLGAQHAPATAPPARLAAALATADSLVQAGVGRRYAGAVLVVTHQGRVVAERAHGAARHLGDDGAPLADAPAMRVDTRFDLASVTKVLATTLAVMRLADDGVLSPDDRLGRWLPAFAAPPFGDITLRHLLTHTAGLAQWQPLYYAADDPASALAAIGALPLGWPVGRERRYSDLGFMLLGAVVEAASGRRLDAFADSALYRPLGLAATGFRPRDVVARESGRRDGARFAATERGNAYERRMVHDSTFGYRYAGDPAAWDGWRRHVLAGEVNDGNAWHAFHGVAGHAGLFSTGREVAALLDLWLAGGRSRLRDVRLFAPETVARFLARDDAGLVPGWMVPTGLPDGSVAHGGFTGTWVLAVPALDLGVVLLTNRQQMGQDARGLFPDLAPLQQAIARTLVAALTP